MRRLAAIGLALVVVGCGKPEPVHNGKSLSEWLDQARGRDTLAGGTFEQVQAGGTNETVDALVAMGQEAVPFLIEALEDDNSDVREVATNALARMGQPAIPELLVALDHRDDLVAGAAAAALREIGAEAVPHVSTAMGDESPQVRRHAAQVLEQIGTDAAQASPVLVKGLQDSDLEVRRAAFRALPKVDIEATKNAMPTLIAALADKDTGVCVGAIDALRALGPQAESAVPDLSKALESDSVEVQMGASKALTSIGPAAVSALVERAGHQNADVRLWSITALGSIGPPASDSVAALMVALDDGDVRVRRASLHAIALVGPKANAAVPAVLKVLAEDPEPLFRSGAASALTKIGGGVPEVYLALVEKLRGDDDNEVRASVAAALGTMQSAAEAIVPLLISALEDPNPNVRLNAARALGDLGPKAASATSALERLSQDDQDSVVPLVANEALGKIRSAPNNAASNAR